MNIVFLSHSAFHPSMVVGSHQLARSYANSGHRVLHISLPFSLAHCLRLRRPRMADRLRRAARGPQEISERLFEWVPLTIFPWQLVKSFYRRSDRNLSIPSGRRIRKALRSTGFSHVDVVLQDEPRMAGFADQVSAARVVYRAVDLYSEMRGDPIIADAERRLLGRADSVVATSDKIGQHLSALDPSVRVDVFPNGFDDGLFARDAPPHPSLKGKRRPRAVYVGSLDDRFDFSAVHVLASRHQDMEVLLYGPGDYPTDLPWPKNVHWMGALSYEQIPAVLQHCDVALLPFRDIPANHARSPMKYHEYRAARLPVVSFAIETLRDRVTDDQLFVYPSSRCRSIVDAVQSAIEPTSETTSAKQPRRKAPIVKSEQSWDAIGSRLLELTLADV